jgi:hypothetical protein
MRVVTKPLKNPSDWHNEFDRVLFVRLYVHFGEENPEKAVRQTLATITTRSVMATISRPLVEDLCLRVMGEPRVQDAINQYLHEKIYAQREMGTKWILAATKDVYERCMQMVPVKDSYGHMLYAKFNPTAALKAVELAGKHVDVQAFKEVVEHETGPNLTAVLDAARKRLEEGREAIVIEGELTEIEHLPVPQVEQNIHTLDELLGEVGYSA